jgi:hypothetical protein
MRLKHNKKRNTAFLFEVLSKELTKSIIANDVERKKVILKILKESFGANSLLKGELSIYKSILSTDGVTPRQAEKVLKEACSQHAALPQDEMFAEQTSLINKINKLLSSEVFDNFVPSYTSMATAYQLFSGELGPKSRVILEEQFLGYMTKRPLAEAKKSKKVSTDKLVMRTHIKKFNAMFDKKLLAEQETLLQKYINSFSDNGLGLKIFLNTEIARLREAVHSESSKNNNFEPVLEVIDSFKGQWIDGDLLKKVLKLQELVGELQSDVG